MMDSKGKDEPVGEGPEEVRRVSLGRLFAVFGWIGVTSIGGGRTAYMYETIVERRKWITNRDFVTGLGLSQVLPGSNVANISVYLGQRLRGARGAVLSFSGVLLPGVLATLILSALYFNYGVGPGLDAALKGMGAAVAAFLTVYVAKMSRRAFKGLKATLVALLAFVAAGPLRANVPLVILIVGAVSLWLHRPGAAPTAATGEGGQK